MLNHIPVHYKSSSRDTKAKALVYTYRVNERGNHSAAVIRVFPSVSEIIAALTCSPLPYASVRSVLKRHA